jgi:hypothetical protein
MDPRDLRRVLDVLAEFGATSAKIPVAIAPAGEGKAPAVGYLELTFAPPAPETHGLVDDDTDKPEPEEPLPPGAFDPIARRKQAASG